MKCDICNGVGKLEVEEKGTVIQGAYWKCPHCNGTGEIKQTNFDRITASPEALAEFMWNYTHDLITDWNRLEDPIFRAMPLKNILGDNCTKRDSWVKWLKQESEE